MSIARRLAALEKQIAKLPGQRRATHLLRRVAFIRDGAAWIGLARPDGPMIMALPHNGRDDLPEQKA